MPYQMIDAHIHLDQYDPCQLEDNIETWRNNGIEGVVAVASSLSSSYRTLELSLQYPGFVYAALGHHPESSPPHQQDLNELLSLIKQEAHTGTIVAIGEVGLPYYSEEGKQHYNIHLDYLEGFISLGAELSLPLALHAVHDQAAEVLNLLLHYSALKAHFHWLKAPADVVKAITDGGYYVSLTPEVCYRERDQQLLRQVPLDLVLLETDGPWPYSGPFQGLPTSPLFLRETGIIAAQKRNMDTQEFLSAVTANTRKLYLPRPTTTVT